MVTALFSAPTSTQYSVNWSSWIELKSLYRVFWRLLLLLQCGRPRVSNWKTKVFSRVRRRRRKKVQNRKMELNLFLISDRAPTYLSCAERKTISSTLTAHSPTSISLSMAHLPSSLSLSLSDPILCHSFSDTTINSLSLAHIFNPLNGTYASLSSTHILLVLYHIHTPLSLSLFYTQGASFSFQFQSW